MAPNRAASPATIPTSSYHSISTSEQSPAAFRPFLSRLQESIVHSLSSQRSWLEFSDTASFSRPESLADAASRVRMNTAYFRSNYLSIMSAVLALFLIFHPASLLAFVFLLASWCFLYLLRPSDSQLALFGRAFSERETLIGLFAATVFVVFATSIGSVIVSSLMFGTAIVGAHGAFRVPDNLFFDGQMEPPGLLPFFMGSASVGSPAAVVPLPLRVQR